MQDLVALVGDVLATAVAGESEGSQEFLFVLEGELLVHFGRNNCQLLSFGRREKIVPQRQLGSGQHGERENADGGIGQSSNHVVTFGLRKSTAVWRRLISCALRHKCTFHA